jgi:virginiamycin B lyase
MTARDRVFGIDPTTLDKVRQSGTGAAGITIATGAGFVWTASSHTGGVSRVDQVTGEVKRDFPNFDVTLGNGDTIGGQAAPSTITYALGSVWVSDNSNGVVFRIDPVTLRVVIAIQIGGHSSSLHGGIAELDGAIWVASPGTDSIVRIDPATNTITDRIPVPYPPNGLVTGDGSLWVTVNPNPV